MYKEKKKFRLGIPLLLLLGAACMALPACEDEPEAFNPKDRPGYRDKDYGDECEEEQNCKVGLICADSGVCDYPGGKKDGEECLVSKQCGEGLYCNATVGQCAQAGTAEADQTCSSDGDCVGGLICKPRGLGGICAEGGTKPVGESCSGFGDCLAGLGCNAPPDANLSCTPGIGGLPRPFGGVDCQASRDEAGDFRFFFEVPEGEVTEFYRLPFPNDIRLDGKKPDLSGHPTPGKGVLGFDIVKTYIDAIEAGQDRFGVNQAVFLRSSFEPEFESINANGDDPSIYLVNVTKDSPTYGETHPISWQALAGSGSNGAYICQNWVAVRPFWGRPLEPETTYAVVLTTAITDREKKPAVQDEDFATMLESDPPGGNIKKAWDKYAPLRTWISDKMIDESKIAVASVYTTGDPWRVTKQLEEVVRTADVKAKELTLCKDEMVKSPCDDGLEGAAHVRGCFAAQSSFDEIHGKVTMPIFQKGQAPYLDDGGDVSILPQIIRSEDVCMGMSVPKSEMPMEGWPVILYAHGTGGNYRGHMGTVAADIATVATGEMSQGAIVIGWDQVQHFTRRGDSMMDPEPLVFNYGNPKGARGNFIQAAADVHAMVKFASELSIPAAMSPTGKEIKADPNRIYFFGHSQGGTSGPLALPFSPEIKGAILSGAGGSLVKGLLGKTAPVNSKQGLQIAFQEAEIGESHPVINLLQGYFEEVDPLNYGRHIGAAKIEGVTTPKHVFHVYGVGDTFTPPEGMAVLARALRAAYLDPIFDEFKGGGVSLSMEPIVGNKTIEMKKYTVAGRQYEPDGYDGHFVTFRNETAKKDLLYFLETMFTQDAPSLGGAP